jgi:hypothetical protein
MPQKISKTFFCRCFQYKCHFQCAFNDSLSVTHVFIQKIFRAPEEASSCPLPPPPHSAVHCAQGGGGEVDLFIH